METDENFSFSELLKFSIELGAYRVASERLYPRSKETLLEQGHLMEKNQYGQHLLNVANGKIKY